MRFAGGKTVCVAYVFRPHSAPVRWRALPTEARMSLQRAHRLNLTVNILFIAAGCAAEAFSTIVYRIAVIVIVLMLRALWARAMVRRAGRDGARKALQHARSCAMADQAHDQALLDSQEDYRSLPPIAAATHRGRW